MANIFVGLDFKNDPILALINLVLYILLIVVIYQLILKITGHSWDIIGLVSTLVAGLVLNEFKTEFRRGKFEGEFEQFQKNVEQSFLRIKEDMEKLKK